MEDFTYDGLNRLLSSTVTAGAQTNAINVSYADNGNILTKSDVQSGALYNYDATKKHAVTGVGSLSYEYDGNGNIVQRNGHSVWWTGFNTVRSLFGDNGAGYTFYYGAGHQRVLQNEPTGQP